MRPWMWFVLALALLVILTPFLVAAYVPGILVLR
jgi:hypothetical protein